MRALTPLLLIVLLPCSGAAARRADLQGRVADKVPGTDELLFLGWNNACSVALEYYSYPLLGAAPLGDPDRWRVGTVTVEPDGEQEEKDWVYTHERTSYWDRERAESAVRSLSKEGYDAPGFLEQVRNAPIAERPGLYETLHTTAAFKGSVHALDWPDPRFHIESIRYSPFGHCAFLVYRDLKNPRASYDFRLVRILDPGVRRVRARAHTTNGLLLYKDNSDIYAAEAELSIAAEMDPQYALALFYHGGFLIAHGRREDGIRRLAEAVKIDDRFIEKAKSAKEYETVREHPEFKKVIRERDAWIHPAKEPGRIYR
ncbi:MAG: hypothetical protein AUJ52_10140 [Elusimicrobia bacterium CG1_02_63_36]|nr:MAG: hypothetical protein AUJ52_10140 [Elusimicrobia bacterium CG1_02_63_36]PIP82723.1 MAG: hypothetical protein COR54_13275 [Elusimicrobia bacterium CG22_combo_CG10-13_8_21_14_all_63_91]PJA11966.1 MAG: hypothetical protein COX66_18460 [Elusimicrobia bacterium CG_4_10_14_0_2_um_filter_63_34]PJB23789.1 MAG: hypothetical protein CO113_16880 [Elusimicrobia bacterium CG_4_9_14_3_um_filter_62_55]